MLSAPPLSRYEGRDKLSEMVETLAPHLESDSRARALTVHLLARIGSVDHEVEEWHKCQETLERALAMVDKVGSDRMLFRQNNRPNNYAEYSAEQY